MYYILVILATLVFSQGLDMMGMYSTKIIREFIILFIIRTKGWSDPLPQLHLWEVHHQDSVDRGEHNLRGGVTEGDDEVHRVVQADQLQGDEDDLPEVLRGQQGPLQVQERGHLHSEE